jgi:hypothetical protein
MPHVPYFLKHIGKTEEVIIISAGGGAGLFITTDFHDTDPNNSPAFDTPAVNVFDTDPNNSPTIQSSIAWSP